MLSRPTRLLVPVLLVAVLAAAFATVAAAGQRSRLSVDRHKRSISAVQDRRTSSARMTLNTSRQGNHQRHHGGGGSTGTTPPVESKPPTETTTTPPVESKPPTETTTTPPVESKPPTETTTPPVESKPPTETTTTPPVESKPPTETTTPPTETKTPPAETTPPVTTPPAEESTTPAILNKIYWGAWIGEQFTGTSAPWDMNAVSDFEKLTQKPLSLVNFSSPFAWCSSNTTPISSCSYYNFPKPEMESIRQHGAIPVFSWASSMLPSSTNQPNFQLSDVIEGKFDSYIRAWATAAKNWGHPFFLRFNWEMNGGWFQWSEGVNGNKAGEYVAAWRHVHNIFTSVGATNVTWVWCPNVDPESKLQNLASLYPGNEYVDWTGLDGYNWGTDPAHPDRWRTFNQLYSSTYKQITETIAPSKPMMIGEVGSTEYGGSKATWIKEMLETIPKNYPKIRALLWFENYADGMDWPIESSTSATQAFAAGIKNSAYAGSEFSSLPFSAVTPAS